MYQAGDRVLTVDLAAEPMPTPVPELTGVPLPFGLPTIAGIDFPLIVHYGYSNDIS